MKYESFGVMLDMSRNAVMKVEEVKKFILILKKMGYDALGLYTEDTYEVKNEKYFGYMRGGYTESEIKEIDKFAQENSIELIPCIQTLAHFNNLKKVPACYDMFDIDDILLIGEKRTYEFIENLFKSLRRCYSTKRVNIGMDEAHLVGLGKYLDKHGYKNRTEVLIEHLNKVVEIASKYGFSCTMWSDMFFRLANEGRYYLKAGEKLKNVVATEKKIPKNIGLTYWDYYNDDELVLDAMMKAHKSLKREITFAGGAWCWQGFAPENFFSLKTMQPAMKAVIKNGIKNVLITMWGDNGKECSFYSTLPSLYAIRQYADGVFDMENIKSGFYKTFGFAFDSFMLLDIPNRLTKNGKVQDKANCVSKSMLYSDIFLGFLDYGLQKYDFIQYRDYAMKLKGEIKKVGEYDYIFDCLSSLCDLLSYKAYLGIETRKAYQEGDKKGLKRLLKKYDISVKKLDVFIEKFKYLWHKENKPFGYEIHDARLGGLKQRILTCKQRLKDYLDEKTDKIDELEIKLLSYKERDEFGHHKYTETFSPSDI